MNRTLTALAVLAASVSYSALAIAAPSAGEVLDANKAATGGSAWDPKTALKLQYAYSGQGMTGTVTSLADLKGGRWRDDIAIGPATLANGYDGQHAWAKDQSGTITIQDGGEQRALAVNDGYRRANLWWQPDRNGAKVVSDGEKTDGGATYDVLTVTPRDGKNFDAWFDAKTHLLSRVIEQQGPQTITSTTSDYRAVDGVELAYDDHITNGEVKYDQEVKLVTATFLPAQPDSAFAAPKNNVNDFSIAGNATETTFPFHLYNNHIYADVTVNGKGPYQFIFDTGGVNLVTPPLATALGLKAEGQMEVNGAGSGHMDTGMTKVSSLQLGNATINSQLFMVMPLDSMSYIEGVGMPGMVGFETFRRFVTRVDYGNGTITLIKPDSFDPKDAGVAVPFVFDGNSIEAPATYNGVTAKFTIDTGSRAALTLNGPFAAKNGLDTSGKTIDSVTGWGVGGPSRGITLRGKPLTIGAFTIEGPVVEVSTDKGGAFADASIGGNIGAGILKRYIVTLDYNRSTMYLKPVTTPVADLDTFDRSGMWINESGKDGFAVVDVTKDAAADHAGLKVGDIIVAVDGKPASSIHLYDLRQRLRDDAPGTVVNFAVKRGTQNLNVPVSLADQI